MAHFCNKKKKKKRFRQNIWDWIFIKSFSPPFYFFISVASSIVWHLCNCDTNWMTIFAANKKTKTKHIYAYKTEYEDNWGHENFKYFKLYNTVKFSPALEWFYFMQIHFF